MRDAPVSWLSEHRRKLLQHVPRDLQGKKLPSHSGGDWTTACSSAAFDQMCGSPLPPRPLLLLRLLRRLLPWLRWLRRLRRLLRLLTLLLLLLPPVPYE